jgi:hypothetical protein
MLMPIRAVIFDFGDVLLLIQGGKQWNFQN